MLSEARAVGIRGEEKGLWLIQREYRFVGGQPTLAQLRAWLAQDVAAREAMEAVERQRSRREDTGTPQHGRLIARARYALLVGRAALFRECFRRYVKEDLYVWHPDREHFAFWDGVLGVGWEGSAAVPAGEAREDIARLTRECYAFTTMPPEAAEEDPEDGDTALFAPLRRADAAALCRLVHAGNREAAAALALLDGRWDEAGEAFMDDMGCSETACNRMEKYGSLPLLPYALLAAVLAGVRGRFVSLWLACARRMLHRTYPGSLHLLQRELGLFFAHLEYLDNRLNRWADAPPPEPRGGYVAQLPLLVGYRALPAALRHRVKVQGAVAGLAGQGLRFLAAFAAAGVRAAGLEPEGAEGLPRLELPEHVSSPGQRFLSALGKVAAAIRRPSGLLVARGEGAPCLHLFCRNGSIEMKLSGLPSRPTGALKVLDQCWARHAFMGLATLEREELPSLLPLLDGLQGLLRLEGGVGGELLEGRESAPTPVLALAYLGEGSLLAAPRLRLLPGAGGLALPGCGLQRPAVRVGAELVAVQRDFEAERRQVSDCLAALRREGGLPEGTRAESGVFWLEGLPAASALLRACERLGLECAWEAGHALSLRRAESLALRLAPQGNGWFELGAECVVDEGAVLSLSELLAACAKREGDFLPLGGGAWLLLRGGLAQQLALLELLCQGRGARKAVPHAALPLLAARFEGLNLPIPGEGPGGPPPGLRATLRPYQQAGYAWLAARAEAGIGAFLADDMGLGKTVQTLAVLLREAARAGDAPSLVIAPVSLLGNWADEAARFAPGLRVHRLGTERELPELGAGELLLASYGQLTARLAAFRRRRWNVVVLDEAQAIKNPTSQRARAACALDARWRLCLTGTPIENSLLDLWSEMQFLNPGLLGTRAAFTRRYRQTDAAAREGLRALLAPLVLRRRKDEVLQQLPPLTEMLVQVEFSPEERALYESVRRRACKTVGEGPEARFSLLAELTRLRRACCHGRLVLPAFEGASSKLAALGELAGELHAAGHRLLVFSQFTDVLDLAESDLTAQGLTTLRLDGSTPAAVRSGRVRRFQQGEADAFLISLKAGGAGLNLTAADYVILLDPWWNPAAEMQAAGRAHRMGQGRPVTLCRLIVRDTVEERIVALQRDKRELAESILEPSGSAPLSPETLHALLGE